jgi:hypothetical protein
MRRREQKIIKKLILTLLILLLALSVSACNKAETELVDKTDHLSKETVFEGMTLSRQDHPELNFDLSEHDGLQAIRDFAVTPEGNLLLLELSKCIYEYSPQGELIGIYDFELEEHGLTAYMLAADDQGNFYLLDGRSQLVIKTDRNELLNVSAFGEGSLISDTGLINSFYAQSEDVLVVSALNTSDYGYYTYTLDVSGENVIYMEEPVRGDFIGNQQFISVEHIMDGEQYTNGMKIIVSEYGGEKRSFAVYTNHEIKANLSGFQIYGLLEDGRYLARTVEMLHGEKLSVRESFLLLDQNLNVLSICESTLAASDIVRGVHGNTFVLRFTEDGLSIVKLYDLCSSWNDDIWFSTVAID